VAWLSLGLPISGIGQLLIFQRHGFQLAARLGNTRDRSLVPT
jgi:hypothetical protein